MSTPKMLALLDKICEDRGRVLDLARYYIADDIRTFHNAEDCVLVKDGKSIEFDRIEDFNDLKEKVKEIEKSKKLTPYFFQIHDDVEKIRFLMNKKILVPVSNVQNQPNLVIEEAQRIIDIAHKYIFIACSDKDYLDQRFEVFRIKHLMMEGSDYDHIRNDEEIDKIATELNKIKFFFKEKMVVKVEDVQADYEMLDGLFAILEKIDSRLYDEQFYPNKKLYKALLASKEDYDKKCNFTYKMIAQDIPRLFARVKQNGAAICLDKPQRYQSEKNALLKRMETQISQIETAYLNKRKFDKQEFVINDKYRFDVTEHDIHSRLSKSRTIKGLKEKYSVVIKELDSEINQKLISEKKMIVDADVYMGESENYIINNIKCFKFRKR